MFKQISEYSKSLKKKKGELEIEIRYGSFDRTGFRQRYSPSSFYNVLEKMRAHYPEEIVRETDTYYGAYRLTNDKIITKKDKKVFDDTRHGIRIQVSNEVEVKSYSKDSKPLVRDKLRYIFKVENGVEAHLTVVNGKSYEIEVEVNYSRINNLYDITFEMFKFINDTTYIYTQYEKKNIYKLINQAIGSEINYRIEQELIPKARNLMWEDLTKNYMFQTTYTASSKADGKNMFMVFFDDTLYIVSTAGFFDKNFIKTGVKRDCIIQGELLEKGDFYSFDILYYDRRILTNLKYTDRYKMLEKAHRDINFENVFIKPVHEFNEIAGLFNACNFILNSKYDYETDGIVFTPDEEYYPSHDILKWKPPSMLTIDFSIQGDKVYSYDRKKKQTVEFKGTEFNPLEEYKIDSDFTEGVIEFSYDIETNTFTGIRQRSDKNIPNTLEVAENIWDDIFDPIKEKVIRGETTEFLSRHLTRFKEALTRDHNLLILGKDKLGYEFVHPENTFIVNTVKETNPDLVHPFDKTLIKRLPFKPSLTFIDTSSSYIKYDDIEFLKDFIELLYELSQYGSIVIIDIDSYKVKKLTKEKFSFDSNDLSILLERDQSTGLTITYDETTSYLGLNDFDSLVKTLKPLMKVEKTVIPKEEMSFTEDLILSLFTQIVLENNSLKKRKVNK